MAITQEWQIDCTSTQAFDLMADLRNVTKWNETCQKAEMITNETVGHGSTFHLAFGDKRENNVTIAAFARPDRLEFAGTSKPLDIYSTYTFAAVDEGTQMQGTFAPTPKGVMKLLLPLMMPMIRRDLSKHHAKFKMLCETESKSQQVREEQAAKEG